MKGKIEETIDWIIAFLSKYPFIAFAISVLSLSFLIWFGTSCSTLPKISENKVSAEGVVQKEKNVNRQTKWYFKPDSNNESTFK